MSSLSFDQISTNPQVAPARDASASTAFAARVNAAKGEAFGDHLSSIEPSEPPDAEPAPPLEASERDAPRSSESNESSDAEPDRFDESRDQPAPEEGRDADNEAHESPADDEVAEAPADSAEVGDTAAAASLVDPDQLQGVEGTEATKPVVERETAQPSASEQTASEHQLPTDSDGNPERQDSDAGQSQETNRAKATVESATSGDDIGEAGGDIRSEGVAEKQNHAAEPQQADTQPIAQVANNQAAADHTIHQPTLAPIAVSPDKDSGDAKESKTTPTASQTVGGNAVLPALEQAAATRSDGKEADPAVLTLPPAAGETAESIVDPAVDAGESSPKLREQLTPAQKPAEPSLRPAEQTRFVQRVTRAFESIGNKPGELRLRLSPPELGSLRIAVKVENGALAARLETDTPMARQALLDSIPVLRERLAEQGIRLEQFSVDVADRQPGEGPGDDLSQSDQRSQRNSQESNSEADPHEPEDQHLQQDSDSLDVIV